MDEKDGKAPCILLGITSLSFMKRVYIWSNLTTGASTHLTPLWIGRELVGVDDGGNRVRLYNVKSSILCCKYSRLQLGGMVVDVLTCSIACLWNHVTIRTFCVIGRSPDHSWLWGSSASFFFSCMADNMTSLHGETRCSMRQVASKPNRASVHF